MNARLFVGTRKGLFTFENQGSQAMPRWALAHKDFLSVPITQVLHDPRDGSIYAALGHGHFGNKLHASRDGGESWEEIAVPAYPSEEAPAEGDEGSKDKAPALEGIWALEAGGADEEGLLWCGTLPGGLFKSSDKGASWQIVEALWNSESRKKWFGGGADVPAIHSVCVDPVDARRVTVGVSCGGVQITEDGGETWRTSSKGMLADFMPPDRQGDEDVQDPHLIVQCRSQPENFWCQHHCGIWRSVDGARSWDQIEEAGPSTFGFAVAVHPEDPETAWFVPAIKDEARYPVDGKVVVTRTRDGGKTFDVLREGLPQNEAYDLTFRHALDIDASGQHLAFGSTTGNLWFTPDQGDQWMTLSHHLPSIYVVRFA
jgi:hypothetical protein